MCRLSEVAYLVAMGEGAAGSGVAPSTSQNRFNVALERHASETIHTRRRRSGDVTRPKENHEAKGDQTHSERLVQYVARPKLKAYHSRRGALFQQLSDIFWRGIIPRAPRCVSYAVDTIDEFGDPIGRPGHASGRPAVGRAGGQISSGNRQSRGWADVMIDRCQPI